MIRIRNLIFFPPNMILTGHRENYPSKLGSFIYSLVLNKRLLLGR
jgi:hypothetical protein